MNDIQSTKYIPVLAVRPAEMNALKELPERDKDLMLPAIQLRPWLNSKEFSNTIKKVQEVFGENRKWIANLDGDYTSPNGSNRPAIAEFNRLRDSTNGYENWCSFVSENDNIIPCVQLSESTQFNTQVERLAILQRGLVLHVSSQNQVPDDTKLNLLQSKSEQNKILFIIDCGGLDTRSEVSLIISQWIESINRIYEVIPECFIAISSTSFPHSFDSMENQEIKERQLYEVAVATGDNNDRNLIYSDRGSARLHSPRGGGGVPYPRIDYPTRNTWFFFRSGESGEYLSDAQNREEEYRQMALETMQSSQWNSELRVWGTQMIERTALGDEYAINSPAKATAVRINIHLHQQLFYGEANTELLNTDDEWID